MVALLVWVAADIVAIKPYQNWRYRQAHPESKCPSGISPSPDRRYIVYADSCFYSPYGTVVAIYAEGEPEGYGTYQTTNAILNMKSGGPVYVTCKTNRDLLVICRHCRERDAMVRKAAISRSDNRVSLRGVHRAFAVVPHGQTRVNRIPHGNC